MKRLFARLFARWLRASDESPLRNAPGEPPVAARHGDRLSMLDCESVMRQLWDYLDGELTPDRTAAIRAHLELCRRCIPQQEFERSFLAAVASRAPVHSNPQRLQGKLIAALQAKGMTEP